MSPTISDIASKCIRCGFCLESCPTFLVTGEETESPRGRIYLIKSADLNQIPWNETRTHVDQCLGCRGCETACPSGVEYGKLLELARGHLQPSPSQQLATELATRPTLLRFHLTIARMFRLKRVPKWLQNKLSQDPGETSLPTAQHQRPFANTVGASDREIAFLEGCAMRVLFPNVHSASRSLLTITGHAIFAGELGCCGALHAHVGMLSEGRKRAESVGQRAQGRTVVTNSAGCGSWLKECGIPTQDISEAIENLDLESARWQGTVTYHDACHLAHGQGIIKTPRDLIQAVPGVKYVELAEADLCCGSAGTYNLTQPRMARRLLSRKWEHIERSGAQTVVLGNPGCHAWIAQAAREHRDHIRILHLSEFLEEALRGYPPQS